MYKVNTIGKLAPFFLAAFFAVDVALRFMPLAWFSFRGWEPAIRYRWAEGPFTPNFHYENLRSYGDLVNMANKPQLRQYHPEILTTDSDGFRLTPGDGSQTYSAILLGDSFGGGCGLNDSQTLAAQFQERTHVHIYNAACMHPDLTHILLVADRLHMKGGLVILEILERLPLPAPEDAQNLLDPHATGKKRRWILYRTGRFAKTLWEGINVSPLGIYAGRLYKWLQNDRWLPNIDGKAYMDYLKTGTPILFPKDDAINATKLLPVNIEGTRDLDRALKENGFRLLVLLVPNKYTVYKPLLANVHNIEPEEDSYHYLSRLENALQQANIPVVNLLPDFQHLAAAALPHNTYLYSLDDTHWNAEGVKATAEILRRWHEHI